SARANNGDGSAACGSNLTSSEKLNSMTRTAAAAGACDTDVTSPARRYSSAVVQTNAKIARPHRTTKAHHRYVSVAAGGDNADVTSAIVERNHAVVAIAAAGGRTVARDRNISAA